MKLCPSEETVHAAKAQGEKSWADHGHGLFKGPQGCWYGFLGEAAVEAFARRNGWSYESDGGFNAKPDITINGLTVGVKTRLIERRFLRGVKAIVPVEHLDKGWDYWLFAAVVKEEPHDTYILGGMSPAEFRERSTHADWHHPCRWVKATSLHDPHHILTTALAQAA